MNEINIDRAVLGAGTAVSGETLVEGQGNSRNLLRGDAGARTGEFLAAEAGRAAPGYAPGGLAPGCAALG